jgi:putative ATP-binding cassette transporter
MILPFWIIGPLVAAGLLKIGAVPSANQAFGLVMGSLSILISSFKVMADLAADVNRLYDLDEELRRYENVDPPKNIYVVEDARVEIRNATVVIPDIDKTLITNVNLTVEPGERLQIVGLRGCGKSSLFRTVFGLWPSPTGDIYLPNRKRIVFVPQNNYIFEGTLREVLLYPGLDREVSDEELIELLKKLKLTDIIERDGVIDPSLLDFDCKWQDKLSGGQQQSVGFLRLFLRKPDVAFLDEATSSLDVESQAHMFDLLIESGITLLTVGHRRELLDKHHKVMWVDGKTKSARVLTVEEYKRELAANESLAGDLANA